MIYIVLMSMRVCVSLFVVHMVVREHISKTTWSIFTTIFVRVAHCRARSLLTALRTVIYPGFTNDIIFAPSGLCGSATSYVMASSCAG